METREPVDEWIEARWIVPVEPRGTVLEHHGVAVRGGEIVALLPRDEGEARFTPALRTCLPDHVLIPGLVNLHTHAAMTLMRGLADDLPLMEWLRKHIWPAELKHANREFVEDGTRLACAEMVKGGITCFNDMYFHPEAAVAAAEASGMRAAIGMIAVEFPTGYASGPDEYLQKGLALRDEYRNHPRISFCLAPHAPYTVSDRTFGRIATLAAQLDVPVHIHLHETLDEIDGAVAETGIRPLQRLQGLGLLGPQLVAVHMVHLTEGEIDRIARDGCHVAHCPSSNLKLASGVAPVAALLEAGVNVGLGTDGAASNNRLDVLTEMRLAALVGKAAAGRADALPASRVLEMATLGGARALGLEARIGSIVPGKRADLTALDLSATELAPCYDPVSHLVYSAGREHVTDVWIDGTRVLEGGSHRLQDPEELRQRAARWRERIAETDRSGA